VGDSPGTPRILWQVGDPTKKTLFAGTFLLTATLVARLAAVLRRRQGPREGPRRIGELVIDPATRSVRVGERSVELANKEFALLRALAADPTRVFTKEELLRDVWDFRSLGRTRTLDSHASRLRRKLDPDHCRYVVNVWGVGYRLIDG
jgi:DNA-binding response OmpR family regulator